MGKKNRPDLQRSAATALSPVNETVPNDSEIDTIKVPESDTIEIRANVACSVQVFDSERASTQVNLVSGQTISIIDIKENRDSIEPHTKINLITIQNKK